MTACRASGKGARARTTLVRNVIHSGEVANTRVREGQLGLRPQDWVSDHIATVLRRYARACAQPDQFPCHSAEDK